MDRWSVGVIQINDLYPIRWFKILDGKPFGIKRISVIYRFIDSTLHERARSQTWQIICCVRQKYEFMLYNIIYNPHVQIIFHNDNVNDSRLKSRRVKFSQRRFLPEELIRHVSTVNNNYCTLYLSKYFCSSFNKAYYIRRFVGRFLLIL